MMGWDVGRGGGAGKGELNPHGVRWSVCIVTWEVEDAKADVYHSRSTLQCL